MALPARHHGRTHHRFQTRHWGHQRRALPTQDARSRAVSGTLASPHGTLTPPLSIQFDSIHQEKIQMSEARFQWDDPLLLEAQLSDEERMIRDAANAYAQGRLAPRVQDAFRAEKTDV